MRIENTLRSLLGLENRFLFLFNRLPLHTIKSTANGIREHKENFSVEVAILSVRPSELILFLILNFLLCLNQFVFHGSFGGGGFNGERHRIGKTQMTFLTEKLEIRSKLHQST